MKRTSRTICRCGRATRSTFSRKRTPIGGEGPATDGQASSLPTSVSFSLCNEGVPETLTREDVSTSRGLPIHLARPARPLPFTSTSSSLGLLNSSLRFTAARRAAPAARSPTVMATTTRSSHSHLLPDHNHTNRRNSSSCNQYNRRHSSNSWHSNQRMVQSMAARPFRHANLGSARRAR